MEIINTKEFKTALKHLLPIVAIESPRNYGRVLYFDKTHLVATDGFRLCRVKIAGLPQESFSIGKPAVKLLKSLLVSYGGTDFQIKYSEENQQIITVSTRVAEIKIRVSNVKYPKYESVFPSAFDRSLQTDLDILTGEISKNTVTNEKNKYMAVDMNHTLGKNILLNYDFLNHATKFLDKFTMKSNLLEDPVLVQSGNVEHLIVPIRA